MEIADYIVASDHELAALAKAGDPVAFEHLFGRHRSAIHHLFVLRTGSEQTADDLLQETFIKVYLHLRRYNPTYTFGQWLYTIARNTLIDFARKRQEDLSLDDRFIAPASTQPTPEERIIRDQQQEQLTSLMERLPVRYRELITLRFVDEYSYEEIAARLDVPLGTVKTRIHRARELFFKNFDND